MPDEYQVRMVCSHAPTKTRVVATREDAELAVRSQARQWAEQTQGHVDVQATISRRTVTPWVQDGDIFDVHSTELD